MGLFSNGIEGAIKGVGDIIDNVTTTKDEKARAILNLFEAEAKDRDSARQMYAGDSSLQKWFALVFLIAYMAMTLAMIYFIFLASRGNNLGLNVPEWGVAFLSTVFGAMSTKVSTICDFLFGGAKASNNTSTQK